MHTIEILLKRSSIYKISGISGLGHYTVYVCCQALTDVFSFGRQSFASFYEWKSLKLTPQFKDGRRLHGSDMFAVT